MHIINPKELPPATTDERTVPWSYVLENQGIYMAESAGGYCRIIHVDLPGSGPKKTEHEKIIFYFDGHSLEPANRKLWCNRKYKICDEELHVAITTNPKAKKRK